MTPVEPLRIAAQIAEVLDAVGLRYVIGGSVAASLVGEPRSTLDIDIMIEHDIAKTRQLARALSKSCYVDEESAVTAARDRGSFNAIHFDSSMKIDFFVAEDAPYAEEALSRRRAVRLAGHPTLYFYAAEDLIVRKLLWFRLGGESSERQWRDVSAMLRINAGALDRERLSRVAVDAGVSDLLARAEAEVKG